MNKIVAIHQPNFFPWLGYFAKIAVSDIFVFIDDVQFPKTGGSWSNRVKLMVGGEARWTTAAIDRSYHGVRQIRDMYFLANVKWREKMIKSLNSNYIGHLYYKETMQVIEPLIMNIESNVADYNIHLVMEIAKNIDLDTTKFRRSSSFSLDYSSNEMLVELTKKVGGSIYLSGDGADGYLDRSVFLRNKIELSYQEFKHPMYPQRGHDNFVPGLSVIDALMNIGFKGVKSLIVRQP